MQLFGSKVRYNTWLQQYELEGEPVTLEKLHRHFERSVDTDIHFESFRRMSQVWAEEVLGYNPVAEYLQALPSVKQGFLEGLAKRLFGTEDPLDQTKLIKWLVSAVARAVTPGCQADSVLVLQGKQGLLKTSFFRALFEGYFQTVHSTTKDTELLRQLQKPWCLELGELDAIFRAKDNSELKGFLSETKDNYRELYATSPVDHPRHCVFAGTVNPDTFLSDPTGSRRFWVIKLSQEIPLDWVKEKRDLVWAEAYALYKQGYQWWMTKAEEALSEKHNQAYQVENSFVEVLEVSYAKMEASHRLQQPAMTSDQIADIFLGLKPDQLQGKAGTKLTQALEHLGLEKKRLTLCGVRGSYWVKPHWCEPTLPDLGQVRLDLSR